MPSPIHLYPQVHTEAGVFKTAYRWLDSSWYDTSWLIRDPVKPNFNKTETIKFDAIASPRKTFLDYPDLLEDIKKSIVYAVELGSSYMDRGSVSTLGSVGSIRRYAYQLMRICREVLEMGFSSFADLTKRDVNDLLCSLSLPEHVSCRYKEKLATYLDAIPLNDLPVRLFKDNRQLSGVDKSLICREIGVPTLRRCKASREMLRAINLRLEELHQGIKFDTAELNQSVFNTEYSSEKQVHEAFRCFNTFYKQSCIFSDFSNPLKIDPFPLTTIQKAASYALNAVNVRRSNGRTRDIPIPIYLKLLDAAARWVIDYSDELFVLEDEMSQYDDPRKRMNRRIRMLSKGSKFVSEVASPFPLASYLHHQQRRESKYSQEFLSEFKSYKDQGFSIRAIEARTGLNKSQQEYVARINDDYYEQRIEHTGLSLNYAIYSILPFCCQLLLLCFTAGRESSIQDLRAGCIRRLAGLRYINLYVPKTIRDYDNFPSCALVEKAVKVMERISAESRRKSGHDLLFQFSDMKGEFKDRTMRFDSIAPRFMDFIDLERDENNEHWKLTEHQFRRAFAVMYFYRYSADNDVSVNALKHHLRHSDLTMTARYVSQAEAGAAFRQVEEEWLAGIIAKGRSSDSELAEFSSFDELAEGIQKSVYQTDLVRTAQAQKALKKVREDSLTVELLSFGAVCVGLSPGRAEKANCAIQKNGEYLAALHKASKSLCAECHNLVECSSLISRKTPENEAMSDLACTSPILDSVIAAGGIQCQ